MTQILIDQGRQQATWDQVTRQQKMCHWGCKVHRVAMARGVETPVTHPDIGVRHFSGSREAGIDHNQWTPTRRGKIIAMTTQGQKDDSPAQDLSETGLLGREGVKTGSVAHHIWAAGIALRAAVKDQTGGLGMVVGATPMGQEAVHPPKIATRGSVNADINAEARLSPNFQHSTASLGNGRASFASLDKEWNPVAGTPRKSWIDSWPACRGRQSTMCSTGPRTYGRIIMPWKGCWHSVTTSRSYLELHDAS